MEVDILNFRYFDANGNQITNDQLKTMQVTTPAMEHIFATVVNRVGKSWKEADRLEETSSR